jgi:hypothetical protein
MNSMKLFSFALFAASLLGTSLAQASLYSSLTADEQTAVNNGEQVTHSEDVDGSVWPKFTVFQRVEATPEQAAGVMFDYPLHNGMFEGITKSQPKNPGAAVTEVDYTMTLPTVMGISLPAEDYTVRDKLAAFGGDGYEVSWSFVKATSMKDCSGSAKFEKLGSATLVSYTNFINPPRPTVARFIVKLAKGRVQDTVKALANQVVSERNGAMDKLNAQTAALAKALGR